jgi:hypothetical protein
VDRGRAETLTRVRCLALDDPAAEACAALEWAGIPAILRKGPVIATRLYDRRVERPYADSTSSSRTSASPTQNAAALALIVAGHAVQHNFRRSTRAGLERAARPNVAGALAVDRASARHAALLSASPAATFVVREAGGAGTPRDRGRVLVRAAFPSAAFMRDWARDEAGRTGRPLPLAGRGRAGLGVAYALRIVRRATALAAAVRRAR